jgi:hypothetical protein
MAGNASPRARFAATPHGYEAATPTKEVTLKTIIILVVVVLLVLFLVGKFRPGRGNNRI